MYNVIHLAPRPPQSPDNDRLSTSFNVMGTLTYNYECYL